MSDTPKPARRLARLARLALLAAAVASALSLAVAARAETRGVWLTTTGPDQIASGLNTDATVAGVRGVGLNTVYVEAWKNGYTQFASPTLKNFIGLDRSPALRNGSRSIVDEATIAAHRRGMASVAWFEYGFAAQFLGGPNAPSNPLAREAERRGWLLQDAAGNYATSSQQFAWMNPAVPEARKLLVGLAVDAVRAHDLDGVQFDDRLSWPAAFGYDATTAALYRGETGRDLPASPSDAAFSAWRRSKVSLFVTELNDALRAERATVVRSVSPSVDGFSQSAYNADWPAWARRGDFDEFAVQAYRTTFDSFAQTLPNQVSAIGGRAGDLVVGLRVNGSGADTPIGDVVRMIDLVRATDGRDGDDLGGFSLFYGKGVLANADALSEAIGAFESRTDLPPDWRPAPVVGSRDGSSFAFDVGAPGAFRLAVEQNGRWRTLDRLSLDAGPYRLALPGVTAAELLVDRAVAPAPAAVPEPAVLAAAVPAWLLLRRRGASRPPRPVAV